MEGKTSCEMEKAGGRALFIRKGQEGNTLFIEFKMSLTIKFTYIKMIEIYILEFVKYGDYFGCIFQNIYKLFKQAYKKSIC